MQDDSKLLAISARHGRNPGAYRLLLMTMAYALENMGERRHLSGGEFLDWLKKMLKHRYGYMGRWLLIHHGLDQPEEVGRAIFELVEEGVFSRREEDTMDDFRERGSLAGDFEMEFTLPEWWRDEGPDWRFLPVAADNQEDELDWWHDV